MGEGQDGGLEVELYCRTATSTASAVDRYYDELDRLSALGVVEDIAVHSWSSRVELGATTGDLAAEAYDRFSDWAATVGVRLEPAFNVQTYESTFTGEEGTALITPVACVAAYDDEDLVAVYPHVDGDGVHTVEDGIEELEAAYEGSNQVVERTAVGSEAAE